MQEGKPPVFLKVDWDKWVDVDEDDEKCECSFHSLSHRTEKKKLCGYQFIMDFKSVYFPFSWWRHGFW